MYWTIESDITGYEFETIEAAEDFFNERFAEECAEESPRNGEVFTSTMEIVLYDFDNEKIVDSKKITLEYEHYHGDLKEHGYWSV